MHVLTLIPNLKLPDDLIGVRRIVAVMGCRLLHKIFKIMKITPDKTAKLYLKWATKYSEADSNLYIDFGDEASKERDHGCK